MCQNVDSISCCWNLIRDYIPIYLVVNFPTYINKIKKLKWLKWKFLYNNIWLIKQIYGNMQNKYIVHAI